MKRVDSVTYTYEDGTTETFDAEWPNWDFVWNCEWVRGGKRTVPQEVIDRLNNIDPNIFPENLFEEE